MDYKQNDISELPTVRRHGRFHFNPTTTLPGQYYHTSLGIYYYALSKERGSRELINWFKALQLENSRSGRRGESVLIPKHLFSPHPVAANMVSLAVSALII